MKKGIFVLIAALIFACGQEKKTGDEDRNTGDASNVDSSMTEIENETTNFVFPQSTDAIFEEFYETDKVIHGVDFGATWQSVNEMFPEEFGLVTNNEVELAYTYELGMGESFVSEAYQFDQDGCFEMGINVYLEDKEMLDQLLMKVIEFYNNKYGEFNLRENVKVWEITDDKEVILYDQQYLIHSQFLVTAKKYIQVNKIEF